jgi:hypothetical protein
MERFEGWQSYSFDDGPLRGNKPTTDSTFKLHFKPNIKTKEMNFFDALYYNARMVADNYSGKFDVCFSGGIDSELVIRINKELGIKQDVYFVKFENEYNGQDYRDAVRICEQLDIPLKTIDFNLEKFVENDLYGYCRKTNLFSIERIIRLAWLDLFDNTVVMGEGEPYWKRNLVNDFSQRSDWSLWWVEDYFTTAIYADQIGRKVIGEWYNYTPEVVNAWHKLPFLRDTLFADKLHGKLSCWSSRREVYVERWKDIYNRPKYSGYEGATGAPGTMPPFMEAFIGTYWSDIKNIGYAFSAKELDEVLLTGSSTCEKYDVRYKPWGTELHHGGRVQTLN